MTFEPSSVLEELKQSPQAPPRTKEHYHQQYVEVSYRLSDSVGTVIVGCPCSSDD